MLDTRRLSHTCTGQLIGQGLSPCYLALSTFCVMYTYDILMVQERVGAVLTGWRRLYLWQIASRLLTLKTLQPILS